MAVHYLKVTLANAAGTPTQFITTPTPCKEINVQNNSSHTMAIGDKTTNLAGSTGFQLNPLGTNSAAIANYKFGPFAEYSLNLAQFWVDGTQNDHLDVIYVT